VKTEKLNRKQYTISKLKHNKSLKSKAKIILTDEFSESLNKAGIDFLDLLEGIEIEATEVPESEIWGRARELIYADQIDGLTPANCTIEN